MMEMGEDSDDDEEEDEVKPAVAGERTTMSPVKHSCCDQDHGDSHAETKKD
jgi:hypothetical protein